MTTEPPHPPAGTPRPAAFLDRDGTLNLDVHYAHRPDQIVWIAGAADALRRLNEAGWWVFVVTNQSGVAQGLYDEDSVQALHAWMAKDLARQGARVDAFYYCPHHPREGAPPYRRACNCRKPAPGMLLQAMADYPVDRARSFMLGDRPRDVEAGEAAGVDSYLYEGGNLDAVVSRLMAAHGG
ncbi:HAD family hydrolase [Roseospira marina]|uniref:D,D-heptose 1,7-bisphosphate phosphatase n=1 Tax=Roseospira marina TaxID=140057 RepID=A0A5M6IDK6_9PROT|nr:HAD family hydrolase [Roseospira marina]KAA5606152.1 HAD family hydrolase [Roseospira marina]MBB4314291.1 D-glycero-D-manno-heptose 1,7-bisphosphate phosphatase [Roseospira marina]MBB5087451.1 D-glycero-D-manno-heptose 1,7-bisphosphate phosphatase [Roseospira marina]